MRRPHALPKTTTHKHSYIPIFGNVCCAVPFAIHIGLSDNGESDSKRNHHSFGLSSVMHTQTAVGALDTQQMIYRSPLTIDCGRAVTKLLVRINRRHSIIQLHVIHPTPLSLPSNTVFRGRLALWMCARIYFMWQLLFRVVFDLWLQLVNINFHFDAS